MTGIQFLDAVGLMRKAQREWLNTKKYMWYYEATRLENLVDEQIEQYHAAIEKNQPIQLDLFDGDCHT